MVEKQPILSVIIPMYNCAPVITRCLDSIDYPDAEVIVVNDGSTDNGADVVRDYKQRLKIEDWRLKIVSKENGGASSARNLGIQEAKGKYIAFIDADDFWNAGGISRIVELAEKENADVIKYEIHSIEIGQPVAIRSVAEDKIQTMEIEGKGKALEHYDISDYHVVDAVFKRSVIVDNNIRFQTDLHLHEDDVFMGMFYCNASKVVSTDLPLYCYVRSSDYSSTHHQSIERQRILINSGYLAAQHRSAYVQAHYPQVMQLELLKYMRWVRTPKDAISAQMTLQEYKEVLKEFRKIGVYPLSYKWINAVYFWAPWKYKMKWAVKTWMINHPGIAYAIMNRGKN